MKLPACLILLTAAFAAAIPAESFARTRPAHRATRPAHPRRHRDPGNYDGSDNGSDNGYDHNSDGLPGFGQGLPDFGGGLPGFGQGLPGFKQ